MDRGGVKPLERDGKPTPEYRSDSALLAHRKILADIFKKRKAPKPGALRSHGATNELVHNSGLTILL
ncbi:hypothetical protein A2661_02530 [Candidatus Giovannonibacteria bacterium RIFCSPHIGHO2_01_FULL_45_24]|nr:MAG: hypothetical protein A2661_02530 [Candidatus Giovannonibacteria bacterium RIFCSPHIGHO2_01_FULL_45_24]